MKFRFYFLLFRKRRGFKLGPIWECTPAPITPIYPWLPRERKSQSFPLQTNMCNHPPSCVSPFDLTGATRVQRMKHPPRWNMLTDKREWKSKAHTDRAHVRTTAFYSIFFACQTEFNVNLLRRKERGNCVSTINFQFVKTCIHTVKSFVKVDIESLDQRWFFSSFDVNHESVSKSFLPCQSCMRELQDMNPKSVSLPVLTFPNFLTHFRSHFSSYRRSRQQHFFFSLSLAC